jgi:hypothetical protein
MKAIELVAKPRLFALSEGEADKDGLSGGVSIERFLQLELPSIEPGEPLPFETGLASKVEQGDGIGCECLNSQSLFS